MRLSAVTAFYFVFCAGVWAHSHGHEQGQKPLETEGMTPEMEKIEEMETKWGFEVRGFGLRCLLYFVPAVH
jgi:hypothetical protein